MIDYVALLTEHVQRAEEIALHGGELEDLTPVLRAAAAQLELVGGHRLRATLEIRRRRMKARLEMLESGNLIVRALAISVRWRLASVEARLAVIDVDIAQAQKAAAADLLAVFGFHALRVAFLDRHTHNTTERRAA